MQLERADLPGVQLITIADRPISEFAWLVKGTLDRNLRPDWPDFVVAGSAILRCRYFDDESGAGFVPAKTDRL